MLFTSQPFGTIKDRIRLTEQGEVIGNKYGNKDAAYYNLEMLVSAALDRMVTRQIADPDELVDFREIMDGIVHDSNVIYRDLVFGNEHFYDYFFEASPIKEVSSLNIGSRPAARKTITEISGLRAIPWVFSWSQNRIMFPVVMWCVLPLIALSKLKKATSRNFNICLKHGHSSVHFCQTWTWCFQNQT